MTGTEFTCCCCQAAVTNGEDVWDGWCPACIWWTGNPRMAWPHLAVGCPARPRQGKTRRLLRGAAPGLGLLGLALSILMGVHTRFPWDLLFFPAEVSWTLFGLCFGVWFQRAASRRAAA
jgi:hypothetical protein